MDEEAFKTTEYSKKRCVKYRVGELFSTSKVTSKKGHFHWISFLEQPSSSCQTSKYSRYPTMVKTRVKSLPTQEVEEECVLYLEDLADTKAPGPLLDENYLCRVCHKLAGQHDRRDVGSNDTCREEDDDDEEDDAVEENDRNEGLSRRRSSSTKTKKLTNKQKLAQKEEEDKQKLARKEEENEIYKKASIFSKYQILMIKHPLFMNAIQSAMITSCSVIVSQIMHAGGWPSTVDWHEVLIGASVAGIWITPVLLIWFDMCSKMPFDSMTKLALDQLFFSPFFTASIVSLRTLLSGKMPYAQMPAHLLVLIPKAGIIVIVMTTQSPIHPFSISLLHEQC